MSDWIKAFVLRVMRVPKEPDVPDGSPGSIRVFRAGANFIRWCMLVWLASNLGISALAVAFYFALETLMFRFPLWVQSTLHTLEGIMFIVLAALWIFTYFQTRLNFEMRWYIVTDRSLRIRSGIVSVQEITMTFANIQEIRVSATPLQVFLGLADVEVHSAGGSSAPGMKSVHVGRFQGVDNADVIRDFIVDNLRAYRDAGLGGHPESEASPAAGDAALTAAQSVLEEVRALRLSLRRA
jgi:membrane protein YdbS with pleckstrin-like domain